jgi:hypothetical protein
LFKNHLVAAYLLLVGVPLLGLLGILEAGRGIRAPLSIGGEWMFEFDRAAPCATGPAGLRQPGLIISQSGIDALITLNDDRPTILEGSVNGATLNAKSQTATIAASIAGEPGARTLEGRMSFDGCAPVAFRAVRQSSKKGGE